jgi:hypothetical protein
MRLGHADAGVAVVSRLRGVIRFRAAMIVTITVALAVAGGFGWWWVRRTAAVDAPNLMCVTADCRYAASRRLRVGEILPLRCSRCDRRSVFGTHVCKGCGTAAVLNRTRGIDEPTYCLTCGKEVRRAH